MGLQRLLIPVHTDVGHTGGGDQRQDAVLKAQSGPQDGDDGQLLACQHRRLVGADGGLDGPGGHGQVTGGLVGQQHGDLAHQCPEVLHAGVLVTHHRQLVLYQGMVHNVQGGKLIAHSLVLRI